MSTQPGQPLDRDEAELARVYRALPGGEPSPGLDARILAQARSAVAAPARRSKTWFTGAGFGLAASAVMAAGIAWQMGWLDASREGNGVTSPTSAPPLETRAREKKADADAAERERVEIEYLRQEQAARDNNAPAADAQAADAPAADALGSAAPAAKPARVQSEPPPAPAAPPAPPPPAPAVAAPEPFPEEPSLEQPSLDESFADESLSAESAAESPKEFAPQPVARDEADLGRSDSRAVESAKQAAELEESVPAAAGARRAPAASDKAELPHWSQDATLDADAWIERIRVRVLHGDRASARSSLRQFVLDHPRRAVPRDLQRLLVD